MNISERDLRLLRWVNGWGAVTVVQIAIWLGVDFSTGARKVRKLIAAGLLCRLPASRLRQEPIAVTKLGCQVSGDPLQPLGGFRLGTWDHDSRMVDLEGRILRRFGDGILHPDRRIRSNRKLAGAPQSHVPDAELERAGRRPIAIEHRIKSDEPLPLAAKQFFYVFDEWFVFAGDHVLNVINMGRSYGGSACLAFQSFADFLVDGQDRLLRQVVGSVGTFVVHELNDSQDTEYAASLFGTQDSVEHTSQTVGGSPTGAESALNVKEFADDFKNLSVGEAYVMNKAEKNKKTSKSVARLVRVRKGSF